MDIFKYIDSRDIREYLIKTGYKLDTLQSAYVVNHSQRHSFWEKQVALREIIACLPDQEVPETAHCPAQPSLHGLLRDHLKWNSELARRLILQEEDAVYQFELGEGWGDKSFPMRSFESCLNKAIGSCDEEVFHIYKTYLDDPKENWIKAFYDTNGMLQGLYSVGMPDNGDPSDIKGPILWPRLTKEERRRRGYFEYIDPGIPVPFQRGDLVVCCGGGRDPFVWTGRKECGRAAGYVVDRETGMLRKSLEEETPYYIHLEYSR